MSQKVTFKPDGAETQWPGDNVKNKDWKIMVGDKEVGTMESQIRDLNMSFTTPGYSVTVLVKIHGVEKPYREYSGTFSNRNLREARENRTTYVRRSKEWALKRLAELDKAAQLEASAKAADKPSTTDLALRRPVSQAPVSQIVPITEIDVYRATLEACVKAEASDQIKLAGVLRAWVDASPFHGCPKCDGRGPWRNEPPCTTCNGDGFLPDNH
jgi:hypothetical protein